VRCLAVYSPGELLATIHADRPPPELEDRLPALRADPGAAGAITRSVRRWHARLPELPDPAGPGVGSATGVRLVCPGDREWPAQLDDLEATRPYRAVAEGQC